MSSIDPSILLGLRPQPSPMDIAAKQAALADTQSQIQQRNAATANLAQQMQQSRAEYNGKQAVQSLLANNPTASVDDMMKAGGVYAIPVISDILAQRKSAIDQKTAQIAQAKDALDTVNSLHSELQGAYSDESDVSKHPQLKAGILQKYVQAGKITPDQANGLLQQSSADDLDEIEATKQAKAQAAKILDEEAARQKNVSGAHAADAKALLDNANAAGYTPKGAKALITAAIPDPKQAAPYLAQVDAAQANGLSGLQISNIVKQAQDVAGDIAKNTNPAIQAGKEKVAAAEGQARSDIQHGNDPRLANVAPALQDSAVKDYGKAQDTYSAIQEATDNLNTAINQARSGNKEAAAAAPLIAVQTINTLANMKRLNPSEIQNYKSAGSLIDNISGKIGKIVSGQPIPADILNDMQSLHDAMAGNAATGYQRNIANINNRYRANFDAGTETGAKPSAGQSFSVKAPNGKTYTFKNQADLNSFKTKAGIP